ncbi:MAG: PTS fructose transporter subunit IIA [Candidatus Omnitrophica bacterium CG07_land_8_20_14_0_80_42_15]|uniref:PTS fructose transporter subunit IIA n=1 Tax=Candidatus Aquitaenariimonas noxiae TaxID=1974741 RepID=A0A2J0KQ55_9BACT|nr:MAG: PTS fructose transporter subunit IIA [Candidatus Omnitrophica bacterium CG07_land_8_20_14_0_80_42_15]
MKISDFLNFKAVSADLQATDKKGVIKELLELLYDAGAVKGNKEAILKALLEREALGSTGIGQNVGIPHTKAAYVKKLVAAFGVSKKGIDFESLDGEPTHIFFLLLASEDSAGPHLKALARISRLLKDKYFRDSLMSAKDVKGILGIIEKEDEAKQ